METIINKNTRIDQLVIKAKLNMPGADAIIDRAAELAKREAAQTVHNGTSKYVPGIPHHGKTLTAIYTVSKSSGMGLYTIHQITWDDPDHSWDGPLPRLSCTCDYFRKANGKRPTYKGQPHCKHTLAAMLDAKATADVEATNAAAWRQMKQRSHRAGSGRAHMEAENAHIGYWDSEHGRNHATLIGMANNAAQFDDMANTAINRIPEGF